MTVRDDLARLELVIDRAPGRSVQHRERDMEAYKRVEAEIARLERQTDMIDLYEFTKRRAEAEIARLRDGLRQIANLPTPALRAGRSFWAEPQALARALLADQDGAARPWKVVWDWEPPVEDGAA